MNKPSPYRRTAPSAGLAASAVLSAISVALQPALTGDAARRLAAVADPGPSAAVSAATFVLAQLPPIVGVLGIGIGTCSGPVAPAVRQWPDAGRPGRLRSGRHPGGRACRTALVSGSWTMRYAVWVQC